MSSRPTSRDLDPEFTPRFCHSRPAFVIPVKTGIQKALLNITD